VIFPLRTLADTLVDLDNAGPNEIKSDCDYAFKYIIRGSTSLFIWRFNDEFVAVIVMFA